MRHPELFAPFALGHLTLRNRIVAPPMVQLRPLTSPEGVAWYRRLAAGGAGLVIVEASGASRFDDDWSAALLRPLVDAIHSQGAAAALQLLPHAWGLPEPEVADVSLAALGEIIASYGRAAAACREAGFDAVEVHGAHGYLLNRFFMPDRNARTDDYGGSLAHRARLAVGIVAAMRAAVGPDYLLLYRHTPVGEAYTLEDSLVLADQLVAAGVSVLDISPARRDTTADLAEPFRRRCGVPVIAVGGMEDPDQAAEALRLGRCDLCAIGRSLLCDAALPVKWQAERWDEIRTCAKCNECHQQLRRRDTVECQGWERDDVAPFLAA